MIPTAQLPTNTASTSPLTARKPACGLSARRRAAISAAGRVGAAGDQPRADHRQPRPGDDQAGHDRARSRPGRRRPACSSRRAVADVADVGEVAELAEPGEQRDRPARPAAGVGVTRRVTPSGEMLTRRSARRAATAAATGCRATTSRTSTRLERQVAGEERVAGERDRRPAAGGTRRTAPKPSATPMTRGDARLDGRRSPRSAAAWRRPGASRRSAARGGRPTAGSRRR